MWWKQKGEESEQVEKGNLVGRGKEGINTRCRTTPQRVTSRDRVKYSKNEH